MPYDPETHHRRSIRYEGFDYSQSGAYFVTVCAWNRECLFGQVAGTAVELTREGQIAQEEWLKTAQHRPHVRLDQYVVMPNHFHGIVILEGQEGTARRAPTRFGEALPKSLPTLIGAFKSAAARRINLLRGTSGQPVWQRNYFEHIIRNDESLSQIRLYIANNPLHWDVDSENPLLYL